MSARIYIPYYLVETSRGKRFYGEAHLSLKAVWTRILVLATPRNLGFIKIPSGGARLEPIVGPEDYGRRIAGALSKAEELTRTRPPFEIGGLKGLLKAMIMGFKSRTPIKGGPELEARLILYYAERALGIMPGDTVKVYPEVLWLPLEVSIVKDESIEAYIASGMTRERFTLLEKFAAMDDSVRESLIEAVKSWKPL